MFNSFSDPSEIYQYPPDCRVIVGIDEVGRGPLAGPVVAAAVVFTVSTPSEGMTDSKKLTAKRRQKLVPIIKDRALAWSLGSCSAAEIDQLNILQASLLAMQRAYMQLQLTSPADLILIDGMHAPDFPVRTHAIIKGDARIPVIGAASILAKEVRDAEMIDLHNHYPQYGFDRHKGYPTKVHREALQKFGPTKHHRKSFAPVKQAMCVQSISTSTVD